MSKLLIYPDRTSEYRWKLIDDNGRIIANGGEAFFDANGVERSIENVRTEMERAEVLRLSPEK